MKRCQYCGTEYPDDATVCPIDREPLDKDRDAAAVTTTDDVVGSVPLAAQKSDINAVYPEYRWSARDAWKFLGMSLLFRVMWYLVIGSLYSHFRLFYLWDRGPFGNVTMTVLYAGLWILTAAYFARTETVESFCKAMGLSRKPSEYVWIGIAAALAIRAAGHAVYVMHWVKLYPDNYDFYRFKVTAGPERYLYLFPMLFAAFWEEPVNRGFLYKAFRGSYSAPIATALIVAWTSYTHWYEYRHFGWAVIGLSALTVVQCYLREKSDSLWDCIWCHFVYNASSLFISG